MEMQERVAGVIAALKAEYPDALCALQYKKDYELMIAVRLSAQCTDARQSRDAGAVCTVPDAGRLRGRRHCGRGGMRALMRLLQAQGAGHRPRLSDAAGRVRRKGAGQDGGSAAAARRWPQQMDDSNGAVPISNVPGAYANGYDVMIAQKICEANGWQLEIVSSAWDSLCPAVQSGTMDANIAGQSMTADRMQEVDMAGPYYYATIVCVTTKDSPYASATSIADLAGGKCTAQSGTIWYDSCLPQIENAELLAPAETAPAMIMQLQTGAVDFICTDMPTAMGAAAQDDNLVILNFSGTDGDFQFASEAERAENVNIGISVRKGNTVLKDAIDSVLSTMTEDDFNQLMDEAIRIQPEV